MNTLAVKWRRHDRKNKKTLNNYTDRHRGFSQMSGHAMHTSFIPAGLGIEQRPLRLRVRIRRTGEGL